MKTVFLDLDGTLTDPKEGITAAVNYALAQMGHATMHPDEMGWVIGPPLVDTFTQMGVSDPLRALDHYRDLYTRDGLFQNRLYDGILPALNQMRQAGNRLVLMTAKPHAYARKITAHFGITPYMAAEYGPELDGTRGNKWDLLAHAMAELSCDPAQAVMVGDRAHDFKAAALNNMASVGVHWGYGNADELAQATHQCARVPELPGLIEQVL